MHEELQRAVVEGFQDCAMNRPQSGCAWLIHGRRASPGGLRDRARGQGVARARRAVDRLRWTGEGALQARSGSVREAGRWIDYSPLDTAAGSPRHDSGRTVRTMDKNELSEGASVTAWDSVPGMSEAGERDDAESARTILRALTSDRLLDTADAYMDRRQRELIGRTIRGRRAEVFLATKFGNVRRREDPTSWTVAAKPEVRAACEASLWRPAPTTSISTTSTASTPRRRSRTRWAP
jgi:hypothetical protein